MLPFTPQESTDNLFGPFISILPREFDSHPLTWLVLKNLGKDNELESTLLALLPRSAQSALNLLGKRFQQDSNATTKYLNKSGASHELNIRDYLWAWLNVNTRCIYYRINETRTSEANVTLCPILDFANHNWCRSHIQPVSNPDTRITLPNAKIPFRFLATEHITEVEIDEEVCLRYGGHSNQNLFVEYGFVNGASNENMESGMYPAEVDVQAIVVPMFEARGTIGSWMQTTLENEGYWGDWILSTSPSPAAPSFRLITALRLFAVGSEMSRVPTSDEEDALCQPWRDTLRGNSETISLANEAKWRATLAIICDLIAKEANIGLERTLDFKPNQQGRSWSRWMRDNIALLWSEQITVARAVLQSLRDEIAF